MDCKSAKPGAASACVLFVALSLVVGCAQEGTQQAAAFSYDEVEIPGAKPWTSESFRNDPDDFQFAILGDRGGGASVLGTYERAIEQLNWQPEFVMSVGVPRDKVMEDYLRSNDYVLPLYRQVIDGFVSSGGEERIPLAILGVRQEYLDAAFAEMETQYGTIENYVTVRLGIDAARQEALRDLYLGRR
jgi:hypothetical protein